MASSTLLRLFLRALAAGPAAALVACSSGGVVDPACASPTDHVDVNVRDLEYDAGASAGVDGGQPIQVSQALPHTTCEKVCPSPGESLCTVESIQGDTATLACNRDCTS